MSTSDGLLFAGVIIVIPEPMRPEMLQILHEPHMGMDKTKSRARSAIFLPGMSITGDDERDHDAIMRAVFKRALERNVKFNSSKVQLKVS